MMFGHAYGNRSKRTGQWSAKPPITTDSLGQLKSHDWLVIARCGILQHMLIDELEPEVFGAIAGFLHQQALLTRGEITTDADLRARQRDELVAALAWFELRMPSTECTTLMHGNVHLFDDFTDWGPGINLWMFPNESYLGWLGGLINDRGHPIPNLLNMHRLFRTLCDAPVSVLREMCTVVARSSNNNFVKRLSKWMNRGQMAQSSTAITVGAGRRDVEPMTMEDIPMLADSAHHALSVAMHVCSTTVAELGAMFELIPPALVLRSRGRRCKSLLEWHGEGLGEILSGREWAQQVHRLRSSLQLELVRSQLTVNGCVWQAAWRENGVALKRTRCKSTFMITGLTLRQYANTSRQIDLQDPCRWFPGDNDTYYGRVLQFFRCRCHGMQSWKYLAAVTMRKAKFGPFPGCAKISRRSKLAPIEIISVRHLQVRTLSVPTPEYVRTRGNLSILTYHGARKLQ
jgi:hypothetical protein